MQKFCLADHCGYVTNQTLDKAIGEHFSLPGHSLSDLSITVSEQSKRNTNLYRKEGTTSYRFWIVRMSFLPSAKQSSKFKDTVP